MRRVLLTSHAPIRFGGRITARGSVDRNLDLVTGHQILDGLLLLDVLAEVFILRNRVLVSIGNLAVVDSTSQSSLRGTLGLVRLTLQSRVASGLFVVDDIHGHVTSLVWEMSRWEGKLEPSYDEQRRAGRVLS